MSDLSYDVAVIGAGPGGAAAAWRLARSGLRVALIEKAAVPRYKTCGGGVLRRVVKLLELDISPVTEQGCDIIDLHFPGVGRFRTRWAEPAVYMTMRDCFDAMLCRRAMDAGVVLKTSTRLEGLKRTAGGIELSTSADSLTSRYVIGADGVGGPTGKLAGFSDGRRLIPAVECEIKVDDEAFERLGGVGRFDFDIVPFGYGWVFPKADHLSIGAVTMGKQTGMNLHEVMRRYLARLGIDRPLHIERHGYVIPLSPRRGPLAREGVLLIGDAAGLVDPITGEGITAAVRSGLLAARAILDGRFSKRGAEQRYLRLLNRQMLPELRLARRLGWLLYERPRLRDRLFARCGSGLLRAMTRVALDQGSYRELLYNPRHYLRLLEGGDRAKSKVASACSQSIERYTGRVSKGGVIAEPIVERNEFI